MAALIHRKTGFPILDPQHPPFPTDYRPDPLGRRQALSSLILSISGFRKVFAADGNETSTNPQLSRGDRELVFGMGASFARFIQQKTGSATPLVALGMDTRFTGPVMAEILLYGLISSGCRIHYLFILPIPELLAYVRANPSIDGFVYVSASHNPIGHNGVKFGLREGVLGGEDATTLIQQFQALLQNDGEMENLFHKASLPPSLLEELCTSIDRWKKASEDAYRAFVYRMVTDTEDSVPQQRILQLLRENIQKRGCGIVIDYNGSARTLGIDREILSDLGVTLYELNDTPREFAHGILPEGDSLLTCRKALEEYRGKDIRVRFGYVPDCDGDRGNLVYYDTGEPSGGGKGARILEAQQVFALAFVSELAYHHWRNRLDRPLRFDEEPGASRSGAPLNPAIPSSRLAVVVNDPTSLRIDLIASRLKARVFRAEVGEANVVGLAKKLINEGWNVPIYGEGSNGGNITYPSVVRDPLATVFSILKLLYLYDSPSQNRTLKSSPASGPSPIPLESPFQLWCEALGIPERYSSFPELSDVLSTLPVFTTLSVSAKEAVFPLRCTDLPGLKAAYEQVFWREWQTRKGYLRESLGVESWEEINYEGMEERVGTGPSFRRGEEKGGLKILFKDSRGNGKAFLWMRKSGTEPVFRILVDREGSDRDSFAYLLSWHRSMLQEADQRCIHKNEPDAMDLLYYLSALIGMQVEDERIHRYLKVLPLKEEVWTSLLASTDSRYLSLHPQGVQILLDPSGFIQTIFLYMISEEGFDPFPQSLPPSIAFPSSRPELQTLLGEPLESGKTQEGFLREREGAWDTFRYLNVKIHAEYRSTDGKITRLTFSRFIEAPIQDYPAQNQNRR